MGGPWVKDLSSKWVRNRLVCNLGSSKQQLYPSGGGPDLEAWLGLQRFGWRLVLLVRVWAEITTLDREANGSCSKRNHAVS